MSHTRDYSILMTLVAKLHNIYNSMKSMRIFGPIEAIENLLLTLLEPTKSILIFQVASSGHKRGLYFPQTLKVRVNCYFSNTYATNALNYIS